MSTIHLWAKNFSKRNQLVYLLAVFVFVILAGVLNSGSAGAKTTRNKNIGSEITIARLQYGGGGDWYCDPSSLPNWLDVFAARTGLSTADSETVVTLDSEDLFQYPFLYVSGHGRIALSDHELKVLRRYLDAGGFLYADDNYGMDISFRQTVAQLFPEQSLEPIGSDHPIFHSFYNLAGLPKIHQHDGEPAQAFGVFRNGRLVVFYSWSADIGDGLEDADVHSVPAQAREAASRMAVNILMYAITHP